MRSESKENFIQLQGTALGEPLLSHQNHGTTYYAFPLAVPRLSGVTDQLNILVTAQLLDTCPVQLGAHLAVEGQVRSFNNRSGVGSRLIITTLARSLTLCDAPPDNHLFLTGALCKPPVFRRTPLGREICDLMLAVNRPYGRTDYLPCIAWGALAQQCAQLTTGVAVTLEGRLQSRTYQKLIEGQPQERTAFEISVITLQEKETV